MPHLIIKDGEQAGQSFEIAAEVVTIGRGTQCDIQIKDISVSRKHATLYSRPDGCYFIKDDGSTYGTFLNNKKIQEAEIKDNAHVKLGACSLEFRSTKTKRSTRPDEEDELEGSYTVLHMISDKDSTASFRSVSTGAHDISSLSVDELSEANKRLRMLYEISETFSHTFEAEDLYRQIIKAIFRTLKVERASIILVDEEDKDLVQVASLDATGKSEQVPFSSTIVNNVIKKDSSLLLTNAQESASYDSAKSIIMQDIRSAMCVPLRTSERTIGAINVDASGANLFTKKDLQMLTLIGNQAGIIIQNAHLLEENIKSERLAAVGQTVASLAHCIKNILQGLKGGSHMVDEGLKSNDVDMVTTVWPVVKHSQERISELVMNMLDYSKERQPAYEHADLRDHMESLHDLMKERANEKDVALRLEYDDSTPPVDCDPMGIYRATLNLLTNAIDAAAEGRQKVRLQVKPSKDGEHILIRIQDNGYGLPPEIQNNPFEAFQSTKQSKGTGLGLAVTKKIVDEHQGKVIFKTSSDKGTTFSIKLPVKKPDDTGSHHMD